MPAARPRPRLAFQRVLVNPATCLLDPDRKRTGRVVRLRHPRPQGELAVVIAATGRGVAALRHGRSKWNLFLRWSTVTGWRWGVMFTTPAATGRLRDDRPRAFSGRGAGHRPIVVVVDRARLRASVSTGLRLFIVFRRPRAWHPALPPALTAPACSKMDGGPRTLLRVRRSHDPAPVDGRKGRSGAGSATGLQQRTSWPQHGLRPTRLVT